MYQYLPNIPNPPTFADKDTLMVKQALDKHQIDGAKGKLRSCVLEECQEKHPYGSARFCPQFTKLDLNSRRLMARKRKLCFLCLGRNHTASKCRSGIQCNWANCRGKNKHNPSLCPSKTDLLTTVEMVNQMNIESSYQYECVPAYDCLIWSRRLSWCYSTAPRN